MAEERLSGHLLSSIKSIRIAMPIVQVTIINQMSSSYIKLDGYWEEMLA